MIGIAGVSCVPTTAKVAQKLATEANPGVMIMPHALGANISGVITSAILAGIFVAIFEVGRMDFRIANAAPPGSLTGP